MWCIKIRTRQLSKQVDYGENYRDVKMNNMYRGNEWDEALMTLGDEGIPT